MPDSRSTSTRTVTLPIVVGAALVAGAISGGGVYALLNTALAPMVETDAAAVRSAAGALATSTSATATPADEPSAGAGEMTPEALREALDTAEAERSQLAGSLLSLNRRAEALETRLTALVADTTTSGTGDDATAPSGEPAAGLVSGADDVGADDGDTTGESGDDATPPDALVAAGLDPSTAADIRRRRDEFQLARLELLDQASREGWEASGQLDERLEALEESRPRLRDELGDDAYDRYLHEEGSRNRVGVASVISGSAAAEAGLLSGDIIVSYAGARVFRSTELQSATREGERGEFVQLGVLRDGEIIAVDVPRGPLGITLEGLRRPPG